MHLEGVLFAIPWALLCMALLVRSRLLSPVGISSSWLVGLFSLKVVATFLLQALYTYYYTDRATADIYRFFDDGLILHQIAQTNTGDFLRIMTGWYDDSQGFVATYFDRMNSWIKPFETGFYNDNHFMIRLNALFTFLSGGRYEIHGVFFSFLSFSGLLLLLRALTKGVRNRLVALVLISLLPSFQLWCSGGVKEAMAVAGMGLLLFGLIDSGTNLSNLRKRWPYLLLGLLFLTSVKVYSLIALTPALLVLLVVIHFRMRWGWQWALWAAIIASGLFLSEVLGLGVIEDIVRKQHDFLNHSAELNPGSFFDMDRMEYSVPSVLSQLPMAFVNSAMRPFPWSVSSAPELLMLLENIYLWAVFIWLLLSLRKSKRELSVLSFAMQFALPIILLVGLTTPVLGAAMRYRAPAVILVFVAIATYLALKQKPISE